MAETMQILGMAVLWVLSPLILLLGWICAALAPSLLAFSFCATGRYRTVLRVGAIVAVPIQVVMYLQLAAYAAEPGHIVVFPPGALIILNVLALPFLSAWVFFFKVPRAA